MTTAAASPPREPRALPRLRSIPLPRPELGGVLLLAAVLNLWALVRALEGAGSRSVMAAVENSCNPVDSVEGLYDCQGAASALAASGH